MKSNNIYNKEEVNNNINKMIQYNNKISIHKKKKGEEKRKEERKTLVERCSIELVVMAGLVYVSTGVTHVK